jgi:Fic family protein
LLGLITKYAALFEQQETIPLQSCEDVRSLYDEICLPEVQTENPENTPDGEFFRKGHVSVYSKTDKLIHEGLFPEGKIIAAMEKALRFLRDDSIGFLERIAIFHFMIGPIHPFYDGNGRLSRFISSYLLSEKLDSLIGVRLSYTVNTNKDKYYKMFAGTNHPKNRGDLTQFMIGFLEILLISYTDLYEALYEKYHLFNNYASVLGGLTTNRKLFRVLSVLLQVSLFGSEGITAKEVGSYSAVGYTTVDQCLKSDAYGKMIHCEKDGKRKLYSLKLDFLNELLQ